MFKLRTVIIPLIMLNIIVFILQIVLGSWFTNSFMLISKDVLTRPWILLTSMFMHGGINHIFFNMYGLLIFGPLLEQRIGWKKFLFIYLLSGLLAAIGAAFFYPAALGASGAIMGMIGTLIILMPELRLLFFFIIPMSLRTAGIIWALIDTIGVFVPSGVGNIAHLVGMGVGLVYGVLLKSKKKQYHRRFSSKAHMDVSDVEEYLRTGRI